MANVNVKLIFIGTPLSAVKLSDQRRQFVVALRKVGKATVFVNPQMTRAAQKDLRDFQAVLGKEFCLVSNHNIATLTEGDA